MADRTQIITGVSFDEGRGIAGIAGVYRGGRLISSDVVPTEDLLSAHVLAVIRQIEITARPTCGPALICSELPSLYPCLRGEVEPTTREGALLIDRLARALGHLHGKVHLATIDSTAVRPAFIAARQTRKAWVAGLEGLNRTWAPEPGGVAA